MPLASHLARFYVRSDNTVPTGTDEVLGINSATLNQEANLLEVTDFSDTSGWRKRILGLLDGNVDLSGDLELGNAPQNLIRSSLISGASIWVTCQFNPSGSAGQQGFRVECKVASASFPASVDGKNEFSSSFNFNAAPTAI